MTHLNADVAAALRRVADVVGEVDGELHVYVSVRPRRDYGQATEAARVVLIDQVAGQLGLTAQTGNSDAVGWQHVAHQHNEVVSLYVRTDVAAPPARCGCGAVCQHTPVERAVAA